MQSDENAGIWGRRVPQVVLAMANWCCALIACSLAINGGEGEFSFILVGIGGVLALNGIFIAGAWSKHELTRGEFTVACILTALATSTYYFHFTVYFATAGYIAGVIALVMFTGGSVRT